MSGNKAIKSAELKEGYWVRIGGESFAVHRVLSVSVTDLPPLINDSSEGIIFAVGVGAGFLAGLLTNSWIIGMILTIVLLFGAVIYSYASRREYETERKRRESLRNVEIELDTNESYQVESEIPQADAERLQIEIESVVANAARLLTEKNKLEQFTRSNT